MDIKNETKKFLLAMLNEKLKMYSTIAQQFIVQYTYFEKENNMWVMKNFLDIGNEKLKYVDLKLNQDEITDIKIYSHNPKYGILPITQKLDMRNKSTPDKIYACDLYDIFIPWDYTGSCNTMVNE